MKSLRYLLQLIIILIAFSSCEKEIMTFNGQDGLYFDVRWGMAEREGHWAHQYYTPIEFGNMVLTTTSYDVHLRVTASGEIKNYDRPFTITIGKDSTNATEGEDYEPFPKEYVLKAGEQYAYIDITFNRTERMKNDTITLQLLLQPNEYFNCPFTNYGDAPSYDYPETKYGYNMDATAHKVVVSDVMSEPEGWFGAATGGGTFGKFSAKKWKLMMELSNTDVDDYTDEKMSSARATVIGEQLGRYLLEQAAKGREYAVIDEDGTMMWCMALQTLDPVNAWVAFTNPDDYYRGKN